MDEQSKKLRSLTKTQKMQRTTRGEDNSNGSETHTRSNQQQADIEEQISKLEDRIVAIMDTGQKKE